MSKILNAIKEIAAGRASSGMEQQFGDVGGTMLKQPLESDVGIDLEAIANARRQHDDEVLFEGALEKLITTHVDGEATQSWDQRYGRLTRTRLLLSFSQTETVREDISLEDIDILSSDVAEREESITLNSGLTLGDDGKAPGDRKEENDTSKVLHGLVWSNCFRIFAAKYRRNYYLRAKSEEERDAWLEAIRDQKQILHEESIRAAQKTLAQKIRPKVKAIVSSVQFQSSVAVLLFCNFLLNIYEVEIKADESTKEAHILKILDYSFTVVYVVELLCNLFAHWWRDFLYNGWSVFDAVCVLSSLIGMLLTAFVGEGMDLSIVRSLRIFKIVRIFSRLKSLQRIVTAITSTLYPLFNTFLIFLVVVAIYAVMASQLYGDNLPERFGTFTLAALSLFQMATGDSWMTDVVRPLMKSGYETGGPGFTVGVAFFFVSFMLFVMIVLVNVAVAVLLEGFLNAIAEIELRERSMESAVQYDKIAGTFDPLLATFANFHSEEHLSSQIHALYKYIDIDDGGSVSFEEFKAGIEQIDLKPPMFVTREDFGTARLYDSFTRSNTLCNGNGEIDPAGFDKCMRLQLKNYAQRLVAHKMMEAIRLQQPESIDIFTDKILLAEIFKISNTVNSIAHEFLENASAAPTPAAGAPKDGNWEAQFLRNRAKSFAMTKRAASVRVMEEVKEQKVEQEKGKEKEEESLLKMLTELRKISLDTSARVQRCESLLCRGGGSSSEDVQATLGDHTGARCSLPFAENGCEESWQQGSVRSGPFNCDDVPFSSDFISTAQQNTPLRNALNYVWQRGGKGPSQLPDKTFSSRGCTAHERRIPAPTDTTTEHRNGRADENSENRLFAGIKAKEDMIGHAEDAEPIVLDVIDIESSKSDWD